MTILELENRFINNNLIPVCAWCGLVRDKQNKWQKINITKWKKPNFGLTHGICPECALNVF